MDRLVAHSTSAEALLAELHRHDLLRQASQSRRAREGRPGRATGPVAGGRAAFVGRVRSALRELTRSSQIECSETL
jgi:hypothetical protein